MTCRYFRGSRSVCLRLVVKDRVYCQYHLARIYDDALALQEKNEAR